MSMKIMITAAEPTPVRWAAEAANVIAAVLKAHPAATIGFPTGETPLPVYAELRRRVTQGQIDVSRCRALMLDEYLDPPEESYTSWSWLSHEVFAPLGLSSDRVRRLPWHSKGVETACAAFERRLRLEDGCDLQILGLGANGHIGFNEPGSAADSRTRAVKLTAATAAANRAYWHGEYEPEWAVTQGIATILAARKILLLARGGAKASILRRALTGPRDPEVPASFLRGASAVHVLADEAAAAALPRSLDYNIEWL